MNPQVIQLPEFKSAQRISVYLSLPSEVNTLPILKEMLKQNKQVGGGDYLLDCPHFTKPDFSGIRSDVRGKCDGDGQTAING